MRPQQCFAPLFCGFASAVFLAAVVFLGPGIAAAQESQPGAGAPCTCPDPRKPDSLRLWPKPKLAEARPALDRSDEIATLEALQVALSEVGDGSSYIWHRPSGSLSGLVQPTASFKDRTGKVCRHIVLVLSSGSRTRRTEGVACRLGNGVWQLEG
jgi:hypothetical protein